MTHRLAKSDALKTECVMAHRADVLRWWATESFSGFTVLCCQGDGGCVWRQVDENGADLVFISIVLSDAAPAGSAPGWMKMRIRRAILEMTPPAKQRPVTSW